MDDYYKSFAFNPMYDVIAESFGFLKHHYPTLPYGILLSTVHYADIHSFIRNGMTITYDDTILFDGISTNALNEITQYLSNKIPAPLKTIEKIQYSDIVPFSEDDLYELAIEDTIILLDTLEKGIPDIKITTVRR